MQKNGFTLIEALMVVSILTIMTSLLLLYNRTGERQIVLLREKSKLISSILRAKNLAFGVLIQQAIGQTICGYGVYIKKDRYFLYRDLAFNCELSDNRYSADNPDELLAADNFILDGHLEFVGTEPADILFIPPQPQVFFDGSLATGEKEVILRASDPDQEISAKILINSAGQVSD